ncbi:MAG: hypothetical protein JST82_11165 [Bacteroidetes bacterium]|nr:hypothetical protein [Bacteroidota bacterium]
MEPITNLSQRQVRPYSYKELTQLYGVSKKTLLNWIQPFKEEIGEKRGRYFTVNQVDIIFRKLGFPKNLKDDLKEY